MQQHDASIESVVLQAFPSLLDHCATVMRADGMPRSPGTIIITTQGEAWVVEGIDPDLVKSIRVHGEQLDDALKLLEKLLRSAKPPWSPISRTRARL